MGKKQTWKGQHFLLCLACGLIAGLWLCGCHPLPKKNINFPDQYQGEQQLLRAKALMAAGDFKGAIKKTKKVLNRFPHTHGSKALFQLGLIYANPKNPDADYKISKKCFGEFMQRSDFSKSDVKDEAVTMNFLLQKMIEKENKTAKIDKQNLQINKLQREIIQQKDQIKKSQRELTQLKDQIKRLKEIDLGVEEKKREKAPQ
jgi:tetratricopeptide (TPR) repeat protein